MAWLVCGFVVLLFAGYMVWTEQRFLPSWKGEIIPWMAVAVLLTFGKIWGGLAIGSFFVEWAGTMCGCFVGWFGAASLAWLYRWALGKMRDRRCPACDSTEVLKSMKCQIFDATLKNGVLARLHTDVEEFECCNCGLHYTGHQAERARTAAVNKANKGI